MIFLVNKSLRVVIYVWLGLQYFFALNLAGGRVKQLLYQRMTNLRLVALSQPLMTACSVDSYVKITEYAFGNSGNNLIEFTHGLWLANVWNSTLIVPPWMRHILRPFDLNVIKKSFCFVEDLHPETNARIIEVTSEDSFFVFNLFKNVQYSKILPPLDNSTMQDIASHFIRVYTSLWSSPLPHLALAGQWIIEEHLDGTFRYTAVHKRSLEGGCNKVSNAENTQ